MIITYTESNHDFLSKAVYGELRATSSSGDVARTQAKIGIVNFGYSIFKLNGPGCKRRMPEHHAVYS